MKKKKYIYIAIVTVVLLVLLIIYLTNHTYTIEELEKKTDDLVEEIINPNLTYEEFSEIAGNVPNVHIPVGPNCYLRNKPTKEQIKKYKLENYVKIQEELANKVEKKYLDNFKYEIVESKEDEDNNQICQTVRITTFYYALYINDLLGLTTELFDKNMEDIVTNVKTQIAFYKVQVLGMKVLDKHLDEYDNKNKESIDVQVCYKNGKFETKDDALGFILSLQGERYTNNDFSIPSNVKRAEARLAKYLKEAKETKIE